MKINDYYIYITETTNKIFKVKNLKGKGDYYEYRKNYQKRVRQKRS